MDQLSFTSTDTAGAASTPRLNLYGGIHKALRYCMSHTLLQLGQADAADRKELGLALDQAHHLLELCTAHIEKENHYLHPALERAAPGSSGQIGGEHEAHEQTIAALYRQIDAVAAAAPAGQPLLLETLYRRVALFVAENFEHMHYEETEHNAVLWAHYTDVELMQIHDAIVASIPPEVMMPLMRWMLPALNGTERVDLLQGMQAQAPAPAFAAVLDLARRTLDGAAWSRVRQALGTPPVLQPLAA